MIFGILNSEKIWHDNFTDLSTSPVRCSYFTLGNPKKSFSAVLFIHTSDYYNPLAHPTWKCHHTNFSIAKLFHLTEGLLRSFKRWKPRKEPVVGCCRWLWKEPFVMCGNWNVRQAMSQPVFSVTTFYIYTRFQSFSTLISRIVHHSVLKFIPCRNKLLPQASTCPYQYTRSSCSVPQTQY